MRKNEEYTGTVLRLGCNGEGILKEGDVTVFLPFALPGEKVRYRVLKVKDPFMGVMTVWSGLDYLKNYLTFIDPNE